MQTSSHGGRIILGRRTGMATGTLIPLEEYIGHSFRPDCDYIDGELRERNVGGRTT
jgi:hypothetical protein